MTNGHVVDIDAQPGDVPTGPCRRARGTPILHELVTVRPTPGHHFRRRRLGLLAALLALALTAGVVTEVVGTSGDQSVEVAAPGGPTLAALAAVLAEPAEVGTTSTVLKATVTSTTSTTVTSAPTTAAQAPAPAEPAPVATATAAASEAPAPTAPPTTAAPRATPKATPPPTSPPTTAPPPPPTTQPSGQYAYNDPRNTQTWLDLAQCESGGNWSIDSGNGYYGGLQFSLGTWQSVGGSGYPHENSRDTQIEMGRRLQARAGWGQWGHCARSLGLA